MEENLMTVQEVAEHLTPAVGAAIGLSCCQLHGVKREFYTFCYYIANDRGDLRTCFVGNDSD